MRKINLKFLLALMATTAVLAGAVTAVHAFQHQRIADALLWQADRAAEANQPAEVARYLQRYLEFRPRDLEASARLAMVLTAEDYPAALKTRQRGLRLLDSVLTRDADRPELRLRAVKTALLLGNTKVARDHLDVLWKAATAPGGTADAAERGRLAGLWGQLLEAERKPAEAIDWCRKAVADNPADTDSPVRLAYLLRRQRDLDKEKMAANAAEADRAIDELVARNGVAAAPYLARWRYRRDFGLLRSAGAIDGQLLERAAEDVAAALKREPESPEVLLAAADLARLRAQVAAADAARDRADRDRAVRAQRDEAYRHLQRGLQITERTAPRAAAEPTRFQLLWHLANLLLDDPHAADSPEGRQAAAEAEQAVARLRAARGAPAGADYLQARLHLRGRRWAEAAALFEQARPLLAQQPDLAAQADLYLGQCYEQLDEPHQTYAAYARAAQGNPASLAARLGLAASLWSLGRYDDAATHYRAALEHGAPPRVWLDLARVEIRRQLQRDDRDWRAAQAALDQAAKADPDAVEPVLLRAEMLAARGDLDDAEEVLTAARKEHPRDAVLWTSLALLAERRKDRARATAILAEAEEKLGDNAEVRLARAQLLAAEGPAAVSRIAALQQGAATFSPEARARLLAGLGDALLRAGDSRAARAVLRELAAMPARQGDLRLRTLLFDLALRDGDDAGVEQALEDLRAVEPPGGALSQLAQGLRLMARARSGLAERQAALAEARVHLDRAAALRPSWAQVSLARAELEELQGNPEQAITHLKQALDQGENSPRVIERLVTALYRRQRYAEADQELKRLRQSLLVNSELGRLAAGVALRKGELARALELARDAVKENSSDFRDQIWHGLLLASAREASAAERKLRKAVELAPAQPEPWVALVQFLAGQKRTADAKAVLAKAAEELAPEQAPLALAQCHEILGDTAAATRQYAAALQKRGADVAVVRAAAAFHLRAGRVREAEPLLETIASGQIKASPDDIVWARRSLALVLANGTDFQRFRRALELVGLALDDNGQLVRDKDGADEGTDVLRARARVLATQGQRQFRERAVELFEALARRQALTPDDQFVLSVLYDAQGATARAYDLLRDLVLTQAQTPRYLARYAEALIQRRDFDQASNWIDRLEALERQREEAPNAYGTVELRARLYEARGEGDRAVELLRAHTSRGSARPDEVLLVVASLARQRRFADGLALCEQVWDRCPPEAASAAAVSILRVMEPTDEQCRRVEARLRGAIEAQARSGQGPSAALLMHLADLYDQRGRYAESEQLYRRVLKAEPNNVIALNNLAWLIVQRTGDGREALPLITTAVNGMGRRPDLMDTRGLVHLALGRTDQALADLKEATADAPTPTRLFHLARAYHLTRDRDAAVKVLRQAKETGLHPSKLHPIEQQACRKLLEELQVQ